ncbi:MAG TPA: acetyl-CoA hydrolase/transferase C-terminal domain-containing protein [Burkholderiales bacterium]|nr:acetyl-CoA hydrolase/transferase C-terminal domain-containing protein [Burkholderiales bacterium]
MQLSRWIRPGDGVIFGQACAEPQTLVEALVAQRAEYTGATLFMGVNWSGTVKPEHADHLRLTAYCGSGLNRKLADAGVLDIHPHPYSQLATLIRQKRIRADVVLVQVSPPNARGEYSLGLSAEYLVPALEVCRSVIAEVNERVPWTFSERLLKKSDFASMIETSREPVTLPYGAPGPQELAIARNALEFIPDGATLETGLGALPDAVLQLLGDRKDLRIHSGSVGDGVAALMQKGVVAGVQGGTLMGTRRLFDFAHENPKLRLRSIEYTHNARVLGGIERFVAINSAIEVDTTGQVNAEVAKGSYLGAVGGALDFVRAANQSPGGVSLMLLPAARIVETLQGPVATPRSEAGVIVTERGAADLRGCTLRERLERMRAIASGTP